MGREEKAKMMRVAEKSSQEAQENRGPAFKAPPQAGLPPALVATFREMRDRDVQRMAEALTHAFGAIGVSLFVTLPERGTARPTYSTASFTVWGDQMNAIEDTDTREAIARHHLESSSRAFEEHRRVIEGRIAERAKRAKEERHGEEEGKPGDDNPRAQQEGAPSGADGEPGAPGEPPPDVEGPAQG